MNTIKINSLYLSIFFVSVFLGSCSKDFLELVPKSSADVDSYYKTTKDFETAIVSAYATLYQEYDPMGGASFCGELMSDEATVYDVAGNSADVHAFRDYSLQATNSFVLSIWRAEYNNIMVVNTLIDKLQGSSLSEDMKTGYSAEMSFLRGLYYFNLVRMFGDIPIVQNEISVEESYKALRSPEEDVYDFIITDLKFAADNLPLRSKISRVGQATQGAALGLLGKVYLTLGDKDSAKDVLLKVINSGEYDLLPDYGDLWDLKHENSKEALFEIQYVGGATAPASSYWEYFTPYNNLSISGQGQGMNQVTDDLWNAFEPNDPRRDISIFTGYFNRSGHWIDIKFPAKWYDPSFENSGNLFYENNFIVLRYADILLMYSEATDDPSYLNLVRERVGLPGFGEPGYPAEYPTLELAIEHEREVELSLEFHRWFDLKRTGRALTVLSASKGKEIERDMLILPIPQDERDINPDLDQNLGY